MNSPLSRGKDGIQGSVGFESDEVWLSGMSPLDTLSLLLLSKPVPQDASVSAAVLWRC